MFPMRCMLLGWLGGVCAAAAIPGVWGAAPLVVGLLWSLIGPQRHLWWACTCAWLGLGSLHGAQGGQPTSPPDTACIRSVVGDVRRIAPHQTGTRLVLDHAVVSACTSAPEETWHPMDVPVSVVVPADAPLSAAEGDTVAASGRWRPRRLPALPGRAPRTVYRLTVMRQADVAVLDTGWIPQWLHAARKRAAAFWRTRLPDRFALAWALGIGAPSALDSRIRDAFSITGTAHLLAVSGLHLGIAALLMYHLAFFVLRRCRAARHYDMRTAAAVAAVAGAWAYCGFTGAHLPSLRAAAMMSLYVLWRLVDRAPNALDAVLWVGAAATAWDPSLVRNVSFQLSFGCVGALLVWPPRRAPSERSASSLLRRAGNRCAGWIADLWHVSLVAAAASTPVVAWHFGMVSPLSPLFNLPAVPWITLLVLPSVLLTTLLSWIPAVADVLAAWCDLLLHATVAAWTAVASWAPVLRGEVMAAALLTSGAFAALAAKRYRTTAVLIGLAAAWSWFDAPRPHWRGLHAVVLDVGQGDATLVRFPDGRFWLVDGGGDARRRIGRDFLVPWLDHLGVTRLDTLVITHPDPDHVAGLAAVVARFRPRAAWDTGQGVDAVDKPAHKRLLRALRRAGTRLLFPPAVCGSHRVGSVGVDVVHPCFPRPGYDPALGYNDNSLVLRLRYQGHAIVLPGDLGAEGEARLLASGAQVQADVLKLGHHGSAGSSTAAFLDAVSPAHAVASCGFANRYGFPAPAVLRRLRARRVRLWRTDVSGPVDIAIDRHSLTVRPLRLR